MLHGDKVNNTDTLLIALIIVVGFAILENLHNMVSKTPQSGVPSAKCQVENFDTSDFGSLGGIFGGSSSDSNADNTKEDSAVESSDADSSDADSADSTLDTSDFGSLGGNFGGDNNTNKEDSNENAEAASDEVEASDSDDSAEFSDFNESDDSAVADSVEAGVDSAVDSPVSPDSDELSPDSDELSSDSDESSSDSSISESLSNEQEEELVQNIVEASDTPPEKVVVSNGDTNNVYVTYDNGTVYVKNPFTGKTVEGTVDSIKKVITDINHPDYVPPKYTSNVSNISNVSNVTTQIRDMPAVNASTAGGNNAPVRRNNKVAAANDGVHRSNMRSTDGTLNNEMSYTDYNRLPLDNNLGNSDYEFGYTFMPPSNWYPTPPHPPVCVAEKQCPVCPVYTGGTEVDLKEWNSSRRVTQPDNINTQFIMDKLNSGR